MSPFGFSAPALTLCFRGLLQVGDARPAGCEARVKVPVKYVTGETRTLRTVNALNGDLIKVEMNPAFAGGLPGGGDWQGLTLVHSSAQLERFSCDRGCA